MKKRIVSLLMATLCCFGGAFASCENTSTEQNPSGTPVAGEPGDPSVISYLVENQAHEEKAGYKFCGYFYDEALTQRVYEPFDTVPTGYYPKYQLDREQLFFYKTDAETYATTSMFVDQVIYAEDYRDAIERYKEYTHYMRLSEVTADNIMKSALHYFLGENEYTRTQIRLGATDEELNKFYNFTDTYPITMNYRVDNSSYKRVVISRNVKWRAYLGKASTLSNGVRYYIVNNEYAVIVGLESDTVLESFTFPSTIEGKPVKHISICHYNGSDKFNVKKLTVPSCVESATIILNIAENQTEQPLEKIVFNEGVQRIKLTSRQTEEVVIPSTAYYVDLSKRDLLYRTDYPGYLLTPDQKVTVNGGEHYYTKDGMLCTTEGDLVHQYSGREKISLTIPDGVRRVLRKSINGLAKTITIPATVQHCDIFFNENSHRFNAVMKQNVTSLGGYCAPVIFLKSQSVAEQWLKHYQTKEECLAIPYLRIQAGFTIMDESIQLSGMESTPVLPTRMKIEGNVVYSKHFTVQVDGTVVETSDWEVYSYLDENFSKDDVSFDPILSQYYELYASNG